MGIGAMLDLPTQSNKYLGQFANNRNGIFLLAAGISTALWRFGDSALARLAGNFSAQTAKIEKTMSDKDEAGKEMMKNSAGAVETAAMTSALAAGVHGQYNLGAAQWANEAANIGRGEGLRDAAGGAWDSVKDQQRDIAGKGTAQEGCQHRGIETEYQHQGWQW
jgi:hypothetical protein